MSMHRRHAGMVVGDVTFYRKFKLDCHTECVKDEMYAQTLLHVRDPAVRPLQECHLAAFLLKSVPLWTLTRQTDRQFLS